MHACSLLHSPMEAGLPAFLPPLFSLPAFTTWLCSGAPSDRAPFPKSLPLLDFPKAVPLCCFLPEYSLLEFFSYHCRFDNPPVSPPCFSFLESFFFYFPLIDKTPNFTPLSFASRVMTTRSFFFVDYFSVSPPAVPFHAVAFPVFFILPQKLGHFAAFLNHP